MLTTTGGDVWAALHHDAGVRLVYAAHDDRAPGAAAWISTDATDLANPCCFLVGVTAAVDWDYRQITHAPLVADDGLSPRWLPSGPATDREVLTLLAQHAPDLRVRAIGDHIRHIIYALVLIALAVTGAGGVWGLGGRWARLDFVHDRRWLR